MKHLFLAFALTLSVLFFTGCDDDARVASANLSKAADNFEIDRRTVFYNGINGEYMLTIEGKCSITSTSRKLQVTCKVGPNEFKKHYLGLSDNVTYFTEQLSSADVNVYHHRITWKPQTILPDIDFRGSTSAIGDAITPDSKD